MPLSEEQKLAIKQKLKQAAEKAHPDDKEAQQRYIFGTLQKIKERVK